MKRIAPRRAAVLRSLACAVAAIGIVVPASGEAASAAPTPSAIEAQIDKQWNDLEPVIEQYNDVHGKMVKNQQQIKKLNDQLTPLQEQVDAALTEVRGMAVDAYMQGAPNSFEAMLIAGNPTGLTDKLTYLDQLAQHQQNSIAGVAKLRDKYATMKTDLEVLNKAVETRDADLAKKKKAIEKQINDLQKLRIKAYGSADVSDGPYRLGPCPVTYTNDKGGRAAQRACDLIGKPYVFGAEGPSAYDCSGLTKAAWAAVGVSLEHYTKDQWNQGRAVSRSELKPGDLVFYYPGSLHHVAIYIGGGMVVHAPHTGDHVRMATIERATIAGYRRPG